MAPLLDILICSIEHRTDQLTALLTELAKQRGKLAQPDAIGGRVFRDNLETGYGEKCRRLLESSEATYVCFVDDDDWVADDYIIQIFEALQFGRDYIGFNVLYTEDGVYQVPVVHSLANKGWENRPEVLLRDLSHLNPIRRELALQAEWAGENGADQAWAAALRALDIVKTETYIPEDLYHYQHVNATTFLATRELEPLTEHPPRPDFPFVVWL